MMALIDESSPNFLSWPTTGWGERMTPSRSTPQMLPRIRTGKQPQQPQWTDRRNDAHVEQSIIHFRARCDFHPPAIKRSISKCRNHGRLITANSPFRRLGRQEYLYRQRPKTENRRKHAERVSPMTSQPAGQLVGTPGYLAIKADSRHTAEVSATR